MQASTDCCTQILASLPANVFVYDLVERVPTFSNRALSTALGYSNAVLESERDGVTRLTHPGDRLTDDQIEELSHYSTPSQPLQVEFRMRHADGSWRWFATRVTVFERNTQGRPLKLVGVAVDITEYKKAESELRFEATHDELTGVYNRRRFMVELDLRISTASSMALCSCDIDHFKTINDRHGHAAGDHALRTFAQLLRSGVRQGDIVGRMGGDEFSILLLDVAGTDGHTIIDRIRSEFGKVAFEAADAAFSTTASFGIAEFQRGMSAGEFLARADEALYRAKQSGRNRVTMVPPVVPLPL